MQSPLPLFLWPTSVDTINNWTVPKDTLTQWPLEPVHGNFYEKHVCRHNLRILRRGHEGSSGTTTPVSSVKYPYKGTEDRKEVWPRPDSSVLQDWACFWVSLHGIFFTHMMKSLCLYSIFVTFSWVIFCCFLLILPYLHFPLLFKTWSSVSILVCSYQLMSYLWLNTIPASPSHVVLLS